MPVTPATQETGTGEWLEPGKVEVKVAVSQDHATALQPGPQERNSVSKKKRKKRKLTGERFCECTSIKDVRKYPRIEKYESVFEKT